MYCVCIQEVAGFQISAGLRIPMDGFQIEEWMLIS